MGSYRKDLAYIHDIGYGNFARDATPSLLGLLKRHGISNGLVVDLGSGSGIWARALSDAGYQVLGIESSRAMITIARKRVPDAEFRVGSLLKMPLPPCVAVTALGECFNYLFDDGNNKRALATTFRRILGALPRGGLLVFDAATPGRAAGSGPEQRFRMGKDWAVLATVREDPRRRLLTRRITTFRKIGASYRRDEEVHRQRLYSKAELIELLRAVGFRVRVLGGYGAGPFPAGLAGFLARKP